MDDVDGFWRVQTALTWLMRSTVIPWLDNIPRTACPWFSDSGELRPSSPGASGADRLLDGEEELLPFIGHDVSSKGSKGNDKTEGGLDSSSNVQMR